MTTTAPTLTIGAVMWWQRLPRHRWHPVRLVELRGDMWRVVHLDEFGHSLGVYRYVPASDLRAAKP